MDSLNNWVPPVFDRDRPPYSSLARHCVISHLVETGPIDPRGGFVWSRFLVVAVFVPLMLGSLGPQTRFFPCGFGFLALGSFHTVDSLFNFFSPLY
jgi:hypothetical protein